MVSIQLSRSRTSDEHDVEACVLQVGIHHQMRDFAVLVSLSHPVRSRLYGVGAVFVFSGHCLALPRTGAGSSVG